MDFKSQSDPNMIYWRRGILVIHPTGRFLVESIQSVRSGTALHQLVLYLYTSSPLYTDYVPLNTHLGTL